MGGKILFMSSKLPRSGYQKLVDEDLEWLLKQTRTLEREHIADIVRESVDCYYPEGVEVRWVPGLVVHSSGYLGADLPGGWRVIACDDGRWEIFLNERHVISGREEDRELAAKRVLLVYVGLTKKVRRDIHA